MIISPEQMHDATLTNISFDWSFRTCILEFAGAPKYQAPFSVSFSGVTELTVPARLEWGPSVSVLRVTIKEDGRFEITMQSGDTVVIVAPNNSFNPMPLGATA